MRILLLVNNRLGFEVVKSLQEGGDEIVGLVIHPPARRSFGGEILAAAKVDQSAVFDGSQLRDPSVLEQILSLKPDIALSVLFDYILREPFLQLFPKGVVNLHPSLLPYNRGQYPNVWSIVEGTPSGVTLHYIDAGIDTGDIISQREIPVLAEDTGETLYRRLEATGLELFRDSWPAIREGRAPRVPQPQGGTSHRAADVEDIDEIDLDRSYRAKELLDILRARTFAPYPGAFFRDGERKIYLRLQLISEADL